MVGLVGSPLNRTWASLPLCSGLGEDCNTGGLMAFWEYVKHEVVLSDTLLHHPLHADGKVFFEKAAEVCLEISPDLGCDRRQRGLAAEELRAELCQGCSPLPLPVYSQNRHWGLALVSWRGLKVMIRSRAGESRGVCHLAIWWVFCTLISFTRLWGI